MIPTYRITYTAYLRNRTYPLSVDVRQKFPPTDWRAHEAARDSFEPLLGSRRNLTRIRVTSIRRLPNQL